MGLTQMKRILPELARVLVAVIRVEVLALVIGFSTPLAVRADERDVRNFVKTMSDYMTALEAISFAFDANLEAR